MATSNFKRGRARSSSRCVGKEEGVKYLQTAIRTKQEFDILANQLHKQLYQFILQTPGGSEHGSFITYTFHDLAGHERKTAQWAGPAGNLMSLSRIFLSLSQLLPSVKWQHKKSGVYFWIFAYLSLFIGTYILCSALFLEILGLLGVSNPTVRFSFNSVSFCKWEALLEEAPLPLDFLFGVSMNEFPDWKERGHSFITSEMKKGFAYLVSLFSFRQEFSNYISALPRFPGF